MATVNTVKTIFATITNNTGWKDVTVGAAYRALYVTAIKSGSASTNTQLDYNKVKSLHIAFGVDTGVDGEVLVLQQTILDFTEETSFNAALNNRTAAKLVQGLPQKFHVNVRKIELFDGTVYDESSRISNLPITTAIALKGVVIE